MTQFRLMVMVLLIHRRRCFQVFLLKPWIHLLLNAKLSVVIKRIIKLSQLKPILVKAIPNVRKILICSLLYFHICK